MIIATDCRVPVVFSLHCDGCGSPYRPAPLPSGKLRCAFLLRRDARKSGWSKEWRDGEDYDFCRPCGVAG